jgi:peptide/nickel transport system permease protein
MFYKNKEIRMYRYALRRLVSLIPVLFGVALIVFTLLYMTPGDPARMVLGDLATEEMTAELP